MTEITRSIEIFAPRDRVWLHIHPRNWTKIFSSVKEVNGYAEDGDAGIGAKASVLTGDDDATIKYNIEITEFEPNYKIVYRRYGGPLTGKGIIQIRSLGQGTLLRRTTFYDDHLSEETIKSLSAGIEQDNKRLKNIIETSQ